MTDLKLGDNIKCKDPRKQGYGKAMHDAYIHPKFTHGMCIIRNDVTESSVRRDSTRHDWSEAGREQCCHGMFGER